MNATEIMWPLDTDLPGCLLLPKPYFLTHLDQHLDQPPASQHSCMEQER